MQQLIERLQYIENKKADYKKYEIIFSTVLQEQKIKLQEINNELILNKQSKELYSDATEIIYNSSIKQLQEAINKGLKFIFYDKNYSIKFELGDSRNKILKMLLIDNNTNRLINLKSGAGAGVRSVVSFIFLIFYVLSKNSYPVLFLDESYSQISAEYVENFFIFLDLLIKEKHFIIVMITHDERFMNYADYTFKIYDGSLLKE